MGFKTEQFVKSVDENLFCSICHDVFDDPVSCKDGHTFCKDCIHEWLKTSKKCPLDNSSMRGFIPVPQFTVKGIINSLEVYCHPPTEARSNADGCDWVGKLECLPQHRKTCPFQVVHCSHVKCNKTMQRRQQENHEKICDFRKVKCAKCEMVLLQHEIEKHLRDDCLQAYITCPNRCRDNQNRYICVMIKRIGLDDHLSKVCPKTLVDCPYKEQGCEVKVERQDVEKHVQDNIGTHMLLLAKECSSLRKENKSLKENLKNLEDKLSSSYIWTIHDFPNKARENPSDDWFRSPAFWLCGCKWYLKLYPNGNKKAEGFLSLYLRLDTDESDGAESHVPWHRSADRAVVVANSAISVLYKLTVMCQKPGFDDVSQESATVFKESKSWGYEKFMKTSDALSDAYCNSGTGALVIKCTIKLCRPI